ncbi:MAG: hypothetical protein K1X54_02065 [Flavobacteriales bacterium]|nr:hypothetical protein [Flavobacteriales bacterium]
MKQILLFNIYWIVFGFCSNAQQQAALDFHDDDHFITCQVGVNTAVHYELRYEKFFHDEWSLLYTFGLSHNESRRYSEFRLPMGASVATGVLIGASACSLADAFYWSDFEFFRLACLIPDGISYHHKIRGGYYFSPYLNWSGISVRLNEDTDQVDWIYTPKAGLRLMKPLGKVGVLSAEQTIQRGANNQIQLYPSIGLSVRF